MNNDRERECYCLPVIALAVRASPAMNDSDSPTSCQRVLIGNASVLFGLAEAGVPKNGNVVLVLTTGYT